ncbi:hypothetical protein KCP76_19220 [Salmonella enterica subsp. enterica serovar Weltevreden]|nr:hypothetical protein KCP76_19220 [Salmonella enterica subsp. enterica serovar Weltevreden]
MVAYTNSITSVSLSGRGRCPSASYFPRRWGDKGASTVKVTGLAAKVCRALFVLPMCWRKMARPLPGR